MEAQRNPFSESVVTASYSLLEQPLSILVKILKGGTMSGWIKALLTIAGLELAMPGVAQAPIPPTTSFSGFPMQTS